MMIRNSLFAAVALLMTGCGIYKPYTRPEVTTDGIYREAVTPTDTASLADLDWRALFPDERLQQLIDTVLVRNTDLRTAQLQVEEAEATLRTARLSLLPSFTPGRRKQFRQFEGDLDLQPSRDGQLGDRYFLAAAQRQTP